LDVNLDRLRYLDDVMPPNVTTIFSDRYNILEAISRADLVIGAVLIPGARAPYLVTREDLKKMCHRAVIVDVAIDQGGCVETSKPTTHSAPTYLVDDVVHYCVANMPGAVPRTSTYALNYATLPYVIDLAERGVVAALKHSAHLRNGLTVCRGSVTRREVAEAHGARYVDPLLAIGAGPGARPG
jgi:alanine dehydrogenase